MYRDPDEVKDEDTVVKVERAAALRRSTIRRPSSTVQPRRYAHPHLPPGRQLADLITERQRPHRSPFVDANDEIQHLEAELEQFRHRILTHTRRDNSRGLAAVAPQDVVIHTPNASGMVNQLPRESALRFEVGPRGPARSGATSPRRHRISRDSWVNRRTLPSPPHSIESSGRVRESTRGQANVPDGPLNADDGYTQDFAPARGPYSETPQPSEGMNRPIVEHGSENPEPQQRSTQTSADTPPPETWEASYPPLRRVGHLSPRPTSSYNGLDNRRRSVSPRSLVSPTESIVNEDHWETLLTTINDDALLHQSSFDSTRSNSEPDSSRSTQTTATSFGEIGSVDDTCDLDLPQGITEADVREIRERNRENRNQVHPAMSVERQLREAISNTPGGEMAMFQNLLSRLAQREDIPAEWWSAAGLARTVRENA